MDARLAKVKKNEPLVADSQTSGGAANHGLDVVRPKQSVVPSTQIDENQKLQQELQHAREVAARATEAAFSQQKLLADTLHTTASLTEPSIQEVRQHVSTNAVSFCISSFLASHMPTRFFNA